MQKALLPSNLRRVASCLVGQETLRSSENTSPKNLKIKNPRRPRYSWPRCTSSGVLAKETLTFFLEITAVYDIPGKTSSTRYDPVYYAYSFQCYTCRPCTRCNSYQLGCGLHFFLPKMRSFIQIHNMGLAAKMCFPIKQLAQFPRFFPGTDRTTPQKSANIESRF
ncbi:MAG: hypothetical protein CM1200mP39_29030 [Dehalococcoidia bacterium]|nr:MAG: hypothetical protein CM1200mP39_29030 [Dehalococcoidia bacterium]